MKVLQGKNGPFVSKPQMKNGRGEWQDVCFPTTMEGSEAVNCAVWASKAVPEKAQNPQMRQAGSPNRVGYRPMNESRHNEPGVRTKPLDIRNRAMSAADAANLGAEKARFLQHRAEVLPEESKPESERLQTRDGFTPAQRFFLAYANVWAGNIRPEEILNRTKSDPHSLGRWRVNGALPQINAWYEAWNVTPESPMYVAPENRVSIW